MANTLEEKQSLTDVLAWHTSCSSKPVPDALERIVLLALLAISTLGMCDTLASS